MAYIYNLVDTWNSVGTTFTAIKMNVTDTASASGSLLLDLQVGGASQFKVVKNGRTTGASFELDEGYISGFSTTAGAMARTFTLRTLLIDSGSSSIILNSSGSFGFTASAGGTDVGTSVDTVLTRDAANTLAQRRSTNAQAFRVYKTFTDASNNEYVSLYFLSPGDGSSFFGLENKANGTGANRDVGLHAQGSQSVRLATGGNTRFLVNGSGHLLAATDNTYDIGASGATRPRNLYVGTNIISPQFSTNSFGFSATSGGYINFTSRAGFESPADGVLKLRNNADTDFGRLQFGGTTSSFPAIKRSSAQLHCRLADDSGFCVVYTGALVSSDNIFVGSGAQLGWGAGSFSSLTSGTDGIITLGNAARTSFGRLQFGGTTSSFPSLKRSSATLQARLADDSAFAAVAGLVDLTATQAADSIGTRGVPQNSQSANYTLVAADAGQHILHPASDNNARTFTIPANGSVAYPVGTAVTFINLINTLTIAITTDTMTLAGSSTTGSRSLGPNGIATAVKVSSTSWLISGTGLS